MTDLERMRDALKAIIAMEPCIMDGGGCFYPMLDGDGNWIADQNVDELSVIQAMVQKAQEGLGQ